ncbi:hypothetical protein PSN45_000709 [Yamadazyma tenuis]|uniref:Uncharacterized protein n=1 Tax=Candida tenuis (strain ATCC 10573 / BCRC 21748 / CBS 615 / JCM 9827 / NBRC 10315 / NRRL Y-1498 / VKM Y-70) TaxID=590646 RepID=G3BA27_CANTC|nr:uncharacterized protein CANTEDRAFT_99098 [Yamadazyma tenuis ATCC 10573]EGV61995.1 hypothetical protein CANTEDRAFT_99098 [Yamadazyma tenuis ATCC 10573]WEJ93247.1 hypothetical protein PSN45_000709 [Yamadazyma tenuis]
MFRSTVSKLYRQPTRSLHYSRPTYSVVSGVKETLEKANKKTGEFLAATMETAEKTPETVGDVAEKVNKKTGKVLAEGMEKVQRVAPNNLSEAADKANKKTGEVLADGVEKVNAGEHLDRVRENAKGYKNLQDKGSKAESEQNRPEDGV